MTQASVDGCGPAPIKAAAEQLADAEALINAKQFTEAVTCLSQGVRSQLAADEKLLLARRLMQLLIQLGHPARARLVMNQVRQWAKQAPAWLDELSFGLSAAWEQPMQGPTLRLRRLTGNDAAWLKSLFANQLFAARVNRDYAQHVNSMPQAHVAHQLDAQARQLPVDMGAHVLVIERRSDAERLGLACLVGIDARSKRAEFIIGFGQHEHTPATRIAEAGALMLELAFHGLGMHRVTASLYSDNHDLKALTNRLRSLGFQHEGVLREHLRLSDGRHVDLHTLGGLRDEVLAHALTRRLLQRYQSLTSLVDTHTQNEYRLMI